MWQKFHLKVIAAALKKTVLIRRVDTSRNMFGDTIAYPYQISKKGQPIGELRQWFKEVTKLQGQENYFVYEA